MSKTEEKKILKKGRWKYDDLIDKGVIIVAINYDYWYELEKADGFDMTDEKPELNEMGEMYMIEWTDKDFEKQESFSVGTLELASTIEQAEIVVNRKIEWI
jgi:hypothetical protein